MQYQGRCVVYPFYVTAGKGAGTRLRGPEELAGWRATPRPAVAPGLDSGGGAAQNRQGRMKRLGVGIRGAVARPQTAVRVPARTSYLPLASRLDPAAPSTPYPANRLSIFVSLVALALVTLLASACGDAAGLPVTLPDQVPTAGGPALPASVSVGRIAFVSLRNGQPQIHAIGKNPVWARLP